MINKRIRYNKNEVMRSRFLQLPWFLLEEEEFKDLSNDARILYALLKNRNELSIANGWYDENDNVYQIFTRKEMMKLLNASDKTVTKAMKDLRKFKLIDEQRMGQGMPNRIYLLTLESLSGTKNRNFYDSRIGENTNPESENLRPSNKDFNKTEVKKTERGKKDLREKIEIDIEKEKKEAFSLNSKEKEEVKNISTNTKKIASVQNTDKKKETLSLNSNDIEYTNHIMNTEEKSRGCEKKILSEREKTAKAPTVEETEKSKAIINELNNCIKKYTNEDSTQDITPKSLNAIVYWLRKGFQLNDFFKIIKLKVKTWLGTNMATQIKPSVLFSENNFQEYLEETKLEKFTNPIYKRKPEQNPQPTRTNCQTEGNKEDNDKIVRSVIEKHEREVAERAKDLKLTPEQIEWYKKNFGGLLKRVGYSV